MATHLRCSLCGLHHIGPCARKAPVRAAAPAEYPLPKPQGSKVTRDDHRFMPEGGVNWSFD